MPRSVSPAFPCILSELLLAPLLRRSLFRFVGLFCCLATLTAPSSVLIRCLLRMPVYLLPMHFHWIPNRQHTTPSLVLYLPSHHHSNTNRQQTPTNRQQTPTPPPVVVLYLLIHHHSNTNRLHTPCSSESLHPWGTKLRHAWMRVMLHLMATLRG